MRNISKHVSSPFGADKCELSEGNQKIGKLKIENEQLSPLALKSSNVPPQESSLARQRLWIICCVVGMYHYRAGWRTLCKSVCVCLCVYACTSVTNILKQ